MKLNTFLLLNVLLLLPTPALCCDCAPMATINEAYKRSDVVVYGTVKVQTKRPLSHLIGSRDYYQARTTIEVIRMYKGRYVKELIVEAFIFNGSCDYQFNVGVEYVAYLKAEPFYAFTSDLTFHCVAYTTSWCTRTAPHEFTDDEVRELRKIARGS